MFGHLSKHVTFVTVPHGALVRSQWWFWDDLRQGAAQSRLELASVLPLPCWKRSPGTAKPVKKSLALQGKSVWKEMLLLASSRLSLGAGEPWGVKVQPEPGFAAICRPASPGLAGTKRHPAQKETQNTDFLSWTMSLSPKNIKSSLFPFSKGRRLACGDEGFA